MSKQVGYFFQILKPSQKTSTLLYVGQGAHYELTNILILSFEIYNVNLYLHYKL